MTEIKHSIIRNGLDWVLFERKWSIELKTLKDENEQTIEIPDGEYKPASLDDFIKSYENLHIEEQHQHKILLQKYEHLFDETLR
jgi:hypothetical protein